LPTCRIRLSSRHWLALALGALALSVAPPGQAQTVPRTLPGAIQPGRDLGLQPPPAPSDNDFDFTIQAPRRDAIPRAADALVFTLRDITIVGATVFPPQTLRPLFASLLDHEVKLADILSVADAIEGKYHEAGYTLTRAFVPPQRVGNGIFTITVVEGFVKAVTVEGGDPASHGLVAANLQPVLADRPMKISTMERALLLANDIPGIAASGLLRPSPNEPGASDLVVTLTDTALSGSVGIDNRGSKFAGPWIARGELAVNSLLDATDQLYGSLSSPPDSAEQIQGQLRYIHPIGAQGMTLGLNASGSYGEPGATLAPLSLVTSSYAVGPQLHYPLLRSRAESLYLDGGLSFQYAAVTTAGLPLSHDDWRVASAAVTYLETGFLAGTTTLNFGVSQGLPIFGATPNNSPDLSRAGAHTDFTKLNASLRRGQALVGPLNLALSLQGQFAFAPLVAGEQIAFGGDSIGRGYDPSVLQGDHGIGAAVELRYDIHVEDALVQSMQPYVFYDAGEIWDVRGGIVGGSSLASTGFGVRVALPYDISTGLEFAQTLSRLAANDNGQLTSRILFNIAKRF
jgi:hemolysin activation/secretion protein